jgi:perosamine synthetase
VIPYGRQHIDERDVEAVVDVLRNGLLTQGPKVDAFEAAVREYVGAKYAVAVASGTAGLHLAAMAAGLGPGSALLTSPITFVATSNAALYTGARPTFADVDPTTVNLSPEATRTALAASRDVRVVSPVHFGGLPCDMPALKAAADAAGAVVVEDAAHALGARYADGGRVGNCQHSLMTVFSFHPVKAIAAGEGGMVTTNDEGVYRRLLRLRSHGINKLDDDFLVREECAEDGRQNPWYYEMLELGFHYRITDIQSALALAQLRRLDEFINRRRVLVGQYDAAFADLEHVQPAQQGRDLSGHHLYVLRFNFEKIGRSRGDVMRALQTRGIGSQVHYIPVNSHPVYRRLGHLPSDTPEAQRYYREALSIPLFFDLTDEQQKDVVAAVREAVR